MTSKNKAIIATIALVAFLCVLYVRSPIEHRYLPCPLFTLTGFQCAACGLTRAAHCILHLEFSKAIDFNPLSVIILPVLLFYGVWSLSGRLGFFTKPLPRFPRWLMWAIFVAVLGFSIGRNL